VQTLFDAMKAKAIPLGSKLLEQEADLDKQFAMHTVTPESLKATTAQGTLRETHLKYHLLTVAVLTPDQMHRYAEKWLSQRIATSAACSPVMAVLHPASIVTTKADRQSARRRCCSFNSDLLAGQFVEPLSDRGGVIDD
jgi:hypothetical protein